MYLRSVPAHGSGYSVPGRTRTLGGRVPASIQSALLRREPLGQRAHGREDEVGVCPATSTRWI